MRTLRSTARFLLVVLPACLAGCASTTGASSKMQTVASVGDKPLPVVTGEPGSSVVADREVSERPRPSSVGRISGRVVDEKGTPMPDVRVRLAVGKGPGGKVIQSTTDRTGAFTLRGVRPGSSYTVIAEWEDDQDHLTGRSVVRAPDTDVRISLAPEDLDPPGALNANASRRVSPVSERDPFDPDHFLPDPPAERSRVNEEDLPPAEEADALPTTRTSRSASRQPREGAPRVARWRRGALDPSSAASAGSGPEPDPESATDGSDLHPASEPRKGGRPLAPEAPPGADEDGPNPLPPALEPGKGAGAGPDESSSTSVAPTPTPTPAPAPAPEEKTSLVQVSAEPPGVLPDLPPPVEALPPAGPAMPPAVDRASLAKLETVPPAADPVKGIEPPPLEPARELAAGALAAAPTPTPAPAAPAVAAAPAPTPAPAAPPLVNDQSIFETETVAARSSEPTPAAPPAAEGRKRPTWTELADTTPMRSERPAARSLAAPARRPLALNPPPLAAAAAAAPPRAAPPRPADDGKAYCTYDAKHRRIQDFRLPDLQGRPVRFQDLDADLVLIDFWGTWCQPCIQSVPHLIELQKKMGSAKFKVVGVACEQGPPAARAARVNQEVRRLGINYPVLLSGMDGPCPLQEALHVQAFPTLVLVDRQGRIVWRDQGATPVTLGRLDRFLASATRGDDVRRY